MLMLFKGTKAVYSENRVKPVTTLCVQNAELVTAEVGGTYI
jgi:hypothetical protein